MPRRSRQQSCQACCRAGGGGRCQPGHGRVLRAGTCINHDAMMRMLRLHRPLTWQSLGGSCAHMHHALRTHNALEHLHTSMRGGVGKAALHSRTEAKSILLYYLVEPRSSASRQAHACNAP